MPTNPLFSTFRNKTLSLENCIVMAPLARATSPNSEPTDEVLEYTAAVWKVVSGSSSPKGRLAIGRARRTTLISLTFTFIVIKDLLRL